MAGSGLALGLAFANDRERLEFSRFWVPDVPVFWVDLGFVSWDFDVLVEPVLEKGNLGFSAVFAGPCDSLGVDDGAAGTGAEVEDRALCRVRRTVRGLWMTPYCLKLDRGLSAREPSMAFLLHSESTSSVCDRLVGASHGRIV